MKMNDDPAAKIAFFMISPLLAADVAFLTMLKIDRRHYRKYPL